MSFLEKLKANKEGAAKAIAGLSDDELMALFFDWHTWARPNQIAPPGDWGTWFISAGRGFGKTRTGAEWVNMQAKDPLARIALIAPTAADARDVMVEGESGILKISHPKFRPLYEPSKRRLTWPNGALATTYSADEPERLRGPQHTACWADELAAWRYPEAWDMLQFGLRLGRHPRAVITTTPKPKRWIREVMSAAGTVLTTGSTYDNLDNLAPSFRTAIMAKYEGTTLGRQELLAELLDEAPGALWKRAQIDAIRADVAPDNLRRVVIGVDPAVTNNDSSDATGIVAVGMCENNLFWVLEDASRKDSPLEWARAVVDIFKRHRADSVIAESNQGGELVREIIHQHDAGVPVSLTHASRGKYTRAEPVAMLYEQGRVRHMRGMTLLEDEMCNWVPGESSPDRMDALVHAITHMNTTNTAPSGAMVLPGGVWG